MGRSVWRRGALVASGLVAIGTACGGGAASGPPPTVVVPVQPAPPAPSASASAHAAPPGEAETASLPGGAVGEPLPFEPPQPSARSTRTPRLSNGSATTLTKRWTARVGKTTFRTTMAFAGGQVIVGTHGDTLDKKDEATDAVYVLDGKTGNVVRTIKTPGQGDRDVSGVAVDQGHVVFTTDNSQVVKARLADGAIVWTAKVSGKARPAPALADLDGRGALDVVVGDETGVLHALDGDKGKPLWTAKTDKNDYDARGFIAAPAIADVDGDGSDDVIAGARDGNLVAYRGTSGDVLWTVGGDSGIHASPSLVDMDDDGRLEVLAAWSYSRFAILDVRSGDVRYEQRVELDSAGIDGLFASPVPLAVEGKPGLFVLGTAWWSPRGAKTAKGDDGLVLLGQKKRAFRSQEGRVSASAIVMDLGDDGAWDAIVGAETGQLLAVRADGTRAVLATLGGAIEASAYAVDVDGDGTFELLVASNDGVLTCFSTGSKRRPLVPRFRGEATTNRGALGSIPLRWSFARD